MEPTNPVYILDCDILKVWYPVIVGVLVKVVNLIVWQTVLI